MERIYGIIDIGTNRVSAFISSTEHNNYNILGKGTSECAGINKGFITDPGSVAAAISSAVEQAESMAGASLHSAYVNLKPIHIEVINRHVFCDVLGKDRKITSDDIKRVNDEVRDIELNQEWQLIDIIPRQYIVDNNEGIFDPAGMVGSRLGVDAYVVCGFKSHINTILRCMRNVDLELDGFIIEPLAIAESVSGNNGLDNKEEAGIIVVNINENITDITAFSGDKLVFCKSLPVGGYNIVNDLSISLEIPFSEAEKFKKQCGLALLSMMHEDGELMATDINDSSKKKLIYKSWIVEIIEARIQEIFSISMDMIIEQDENLFDAKEVLLTGNGISQILGCIELANNVFSIPARAVLLEALEDPEYSTCQIMARFLARCPGDLWPGSNVEFFSISGKKAKKGILDKIVAFLERFL